MQPKIIILASGNGSNAQCIAEYFNRKGSAEVSLIMSNNPEAYVLERAKLLSIPAVVFHRQEFYHSNIVIERMLEENPAFIVLAGFLWLVPEIIIRHFSGRIINIHPALLPKFGGKGMYGQKVHEAVIAAGEKESGITIHYVNKNYDDGDIIRQVICPVLPNDTPESLAKRVHGLEYTYYPLVIEELLTQIQ